MSVIARRKHLIEIAESIKAGSILSDGDATFLYDALIKIAGGEDPNSALDIKAKRGERISKDYQDKVKQGELMKSFALGWLATATAPEEEGGLGLSNEVAFGMIGELSPVFKDTKAFGFTEETLKTYWAQNPDKHERNFKLPD
jgi:hypothetical protein